MRSFGSVQVYIEDRGRREGRLQGNRICAKNPLPPAGEGGSNSRKGRRGGANHPHPNPLPGGEGDTGRLSSYAIPLPSAVGRGRSDRAVHQTATVAWRALFGYDPRP